MGRRKLKVEFIEKQKSRLLTLKNRKEGLKKKLHQLTTLCDVPACIIIRDPTTNSTFIWPDDSALIRRLIDSYKADPAAVRAFGVSDFFKGNAEEGLVKKKAEAKYGNWDDRLDHMDESQLRELSDAVRAKAEALRSRSDFLKREEEEEQNSDDMLDLEDMFDQDEILSIADAVAANANGQLAVPDFYCPPPLNLPMLEEEKSDDNVVLDLVGFDQDYTFSVADVMANAQLPVPFVDHNYLNYGYCSPMDGNVNWCALNMDQNLNGSVNCFAGDDGADLASYFWH
ncbi:agamous-like MADS-box protein AGL27 [Salvia hispanica]|uniref:agamous-like MADS-box protein AGL27 n=1 Tax=Salvia hispanica TaxID=49212 RepID=UPI0020099B66|nr:agamous-like MADS-box protein AGL27 [Salvia hispanica]XP_047965176.1 agamous-like MADS-box protein AGL27 [Salvia hispanica]